MAILNKVTIKITGTPPNSSMSLQILLEKFCLLRNAKSIGDTETVNHYQLGKLIFHNIPYIKINQQ